MIRRRHQRLEEFEAKSEPDIVKLSVAGVNEAETELAVKDSVAKTREWADSVRAEQRSKWKEENSGDDEDDGQWILEWKAKKANAQAAFEAMLRKDEEDFATKQGGRV